MPETMSNERRVLLRAYGAELDPHPGREGMDGAVAKAQADRRGDRHAARSWPASSPTRPTPRSTARPPPRRSGPTPTARSTSSSPASAPAARSPASGRSSRRASPACRSSASSRRSPRSSTAAHPGPHKIQGIGANFVPEILDRTVYDEIIDVDAETSVAVARDAAKRRGHPRSASPPAPPSWAALEAGQAPRERRQAHRRDRLRLRRALPRPGARTHDPRTDGASCGLLFTGCARTCRPPATTIRPRAVDSSRIALVYPGLHAIWSYRLAHRMWREPRAAVAGPAALAAGPVAHRYRDPSRRDDRPPVLHRPRHGRGDRRDRRGRRRRDALPRRDAGRPVAARRASATPRSGQRDRRRRAPRCSARCRSATGVQIGANAVVSPTMCRPIRSRPVSPRSCARAPRSSVNRASIRPPTSIRRCTSERLAQRRYT